MEGTAVITHSSNTKSERSSSDVCSSITSSSGFQPENIVGVLFGFICPSESEETKSIRESTISSQTDSASQAKGNPEVTSSATNDISFDNNQ